jgi:hypothetical protein
VKKNKVKEFTISYIIITTYTQSLAQYVIGGKEENR